MGAVYADLAVRLSRRGQGRRTWRVRRTTGKRYEVGRQFPLHNDRSKREHAQNDHAFRTKIHGNVSIAMIKVGTAVLAFS